MDLVVLRIDVDELAGFKSNASQILRNTLKGMPRKEQDSQPRTVQHIWLNHSAPPATGRDLAPQYVSGHPVGELFQKLTHESLGVQ